MQKGHRAFLGTDPTSAQARLYDGFPTHRGVSSRALDVELFQATAIVALVQTFTMKQVPDPHRVYFFVPPKHEKWAIGQFRGFAEVVFGRLKERKDAQRAPSVGRLFHAIMLGCRVLQMQTPPDRWVAFGFAKSDLVPDWLGAGLLPMG